MSRYDSGQDEHYDESDDSYEEDMRNLARKHNQNASQSVDGGHDRGEDESHVSQKPIFQSKLLKMKSKKSFISKLEVEQTLLHGRANNR